MVRKIVPASCTTEQAAGGFNYDPLGDIASRSIHEVPVLSKHIRDDLPRGVRRRYADLRIRGGWRDLPCPETDGANDAATTRPWGAFIRRQDAEVCACENDGIEGGRKVASRSWMRERGLISSHSLRFQAKFRACSAACGVRKMHPAWVCPWTALKRGKGAWTRVG